MDQLIREIESIPEEDAGQCPENAAPRLNLAGRTVETIFIGGGTPSLLPPSAVERILAAVRQVFRVEPDAEITMEANPGTLTPDSGSRLPECRGQPPESGAAVGFGGGIAAFRADSYAGAVFAELSCCAGRWI